MYDYYLRIKGGNKKRKYSSIISKSMNEGDRELERLYGKLSWY